jgi:hypothetical protein
MENYTPLIQRMLTALGNPLINNSYVWSLAGGIPEDFKGNVLQYIIDTNELESLSANDWQLIAVKFGITEPSNGSWLYSIVKLLEQ